METTKKISATNSGATSGAFRKEYSENRLMTIGIRATIMIPSNPNTLATAMPAGRQVAFFSLNDV